MGCAAHFTASPLAANRFNSGWQTDDRQETAASSSGLSPLVADERERASGSFEGWEKNFSTMDSGVGNTPDGAAFRIRGRK